jgi:hypothetical protein
LSANRWLMSALPQLLEIERTSAMRFTSQALG